MSETNVHSTNPIVCPSCGEVLVVAPKQNDVSCNCGFSAFAPYVTEANYLRAGMPKWQARLAELEDAINRGLRPEGAPTGTEQFSAKKPAGAYQYLVGGGSILLFAGLAAFVGIMWRYLGIWGQGAVLASVTVLLAALADRLATRIQSTATALSALTVGSWLIDVGWVIYRLGTENRLDNTLLIPALLSIVTAAVFLFLGKRYANAVWELVGQVFIPVSIGLALTSAELNIASGADETSVQLSALALPMTVSILLLIANASVVQQLFTSLSRTLALVVFSIFAFGFILASVQADDRAALAWSIHLVFLSAFAFSKPKLRGISAALVAGSVVLSAAFAEFPISVRAVFPAIFGLLSLLFRKESKIPLALLVSATSGAWLFLAFNNFPADELRPHAAALSVVTGLVVLAHAWFAKRSEYVAFGSGFLALAIIFTNVYLEITKLEAFTLFIALIFLICGWYAYRINSELSSLLWLGPSCFVALVPSALRATSSLDYSLRFSVSLIAAIALLIVGARLRYVGMLAAGLLAVVILARNPLTFLFNAVQPWISFTLSGVLLLVIGARFEHLRKRAGVAKEWITGSLR